MFVSEVYLERLLTQLFALGPAVTPADLVMLVAPSARSRVKRMLMVIEAGLEPQLAPFATAVVFGLAVLGPTAVHAAGAGHRRKTSSSIRSRRS